MTAMPVHSFYRNVPVHDFQPQDRVVTIVQPAINRVLATRDLDELFALARDHHQPPEVRLYCRARLLAEREAAGIGRSFGIDLALLRASTAGLTLDWMSSSHYCSGLDVWAPESPPPPRRPPEYRDALAAAQQAARRAASDG